MVDQQKTSREYLIEGNTLLENKDVYGAIACYQRSTQLEPSLPETHHNLGEAFSQLERWEEAISSYQRAVQLNPDLAITYQRLADILDKLQQWEAAIQAYQTSFDLQPDSFQACHKLAQLLLQQGQTQRAIDYYLIAIKLQPFFQWSYWNLWNILAQNHRLQEAVDLYRIALENYPDSPLVELNLGDALTRQGKLSQAISCYERSSYKKLQQIAPETVEKFWDIEQRLMPQFIIIGVQKGGTTSLYRYLSEHPQVVPAIKKEIHFWNHHYKRGLDWYLSHFPKLSTDQQLFITGEASPNYFEDVTVAERIYQAFPQMKLILLLRNPVDRAVSQYYHWMRLGTEKNTLEAAIETEMELLGDYPQSTTLNSAYWQLSSKYLWRGIYGVFLKQWLDIFPREQLLILSSEEFYQHPQSILEQVFEFLGLSPYVLPEYHVYNQGFYQPMPEAVRGKLTDYFAPHNQDLAELLGFHLNWS